MFNLCKCTFTAAAAAAAAAAAVSYFATSIKCVVTCIVRLCQSFADIHTLCPARQLGTAVLKVLIKTPLYECLC